jgi:superfamily I DNA/RNA helicase
LQDKKISLTPKQIECVNHPAESDLLVRGIAGSGKSLVIIRRALQINKYFRENGEVPRIAVFTYANSLVRYMQELTTLDADVKDNITISTLDHEILQIYKRVVDKYTSNIQFDIDSDELASVVNSVGNSSNNRFLQKNMRTFLEDEIVWIKQRLISNCESYVACVRTGRGAVRPSADDRRLIYRIYDKYYDVLKKKRKLDINVMYEQLYQKRKFIPEDMKYDFVLIDESQDLPLNKLLIAKAITIESMTLAADQAQKIYKTGFTWRELGIDITSHSSKKLTGTFRNTYEIMALANSLVKKNTELRAMKDEYIPPEMPDRHGSTPVLVILDSYAKVKEQIITLLKEYHEKKADRTVAVILPTRKDINTVEKWLKTNTLPYQIILKGKNYQVIEPGIKLVTYYSAKGLEFDDVIIPYLEAGSMPKIPSNASEDEKTDIMNHARNLLYVGMTRARNMLYLFCCNSTLYKPSPLIDELDKQYYDVVNM